MNGQLLQPEPSRRNMLKESAALLVGGIAGAAVGAYAATPAVGEAPAATPPLPWKWARLDPLEAGRRAYRFYKEKGGCGTASYLSLLSHAEGEGRLPMDDAAGHDDGPRGGRLRRPRNLVRRPRRCFDDHQHGHLQRQARRAAEQPDHRPAVLVVCRAELSERAFRRHLPDAETDQGEGDVAAFATPRYRNGSWPPVRR